MVVTISHEGYIKRVPLASYRAQRRGGQGARGGKTKEGDFIEHFFVASTKAYLLCFANTGRMYWLKVYKIPTASRTSPGRSIANVLSLAAEEKITSIVPVREFTEGLHLLMATRQGTVKKSDLMAYSMAVAMRSEMLASTARRCSVRIVDVDPQSGRMSLKAVV